MLADGHLNSAWLAARLPARARTLTDLRLTMMVRPLRPVLGLAAMAGDKEISVSQLQAGAESLEPPLLSPAALLDALDAVVVIAAPWNNPWVRRSAGQHPLAVLRAAVTRLARLPHAVVDDCTLRQDR